MMSTTACRFAAAGVPTVVFQRLDFLHIVKTLDLAPFSPIYVLLPHNPDDRPYVEFVISLAGAQAARQVQDAQTIIADCTRRGRVEMELRQRRVWTEVRTATSDPTARAYCTYSWNWLKDSIDAGKVLPIHGYRSYDGVQVFHPDQIPAPVPEAPTKKRRHSDSDRTDPQS